MKTAKLFLILTVISIQSAIYATVPTNKTKHTVNDKNKNGDTTKIVYLPKVPVLSQYNEYPAQEIYSVWDTSVIHPYYPEDQFIGDSIVLQLEENGDPFTMPWKGMVTSGYGWRHGRPHTGTDIDLETGDTVVAAFNGKVRVARVAGGYGNCVIIRHANGLETVYGHLSKILVRTGDEICSGQIIGLGGNTGHSFGSHLHFEMRYLGKSINTERVIDYKNWGLKHAEFKLKKSDLVMAKVSYSSGFSKRHHRKKGRFNSNIRYSTAKKGTAKKSKISSERRIPTRNAVALKSVKKRVQSQKSKSKRSYHRA